MMPLFEHRYWRVVVSVGKLLLPNTEVPGVPISRRRHENVEFWKEGLLAPVPGPTSPLFMVRFMVVGHFGRVAGVVDIVFMVVEVLRRVVIFLHLVVTRLVSRRRRRGLICRWLRWLICLFIDLIGVVFETNFDHCFLVWSLFVVARTCSSEFRTPMSLVEVDPLRALLSSPFLVFRL